MAVAGLLLLAVVALLSLNLFEGQIRDYMERQLNERVEGYRFAIGHVDIHPFTLSVDLEGLRVAQADHPDPPIAEIPVWHAAVQWGSLFKGDVVSEHRIERPVFYFARPQAKKEAQAAKESVKEGTPQKRWQETATTIYPVTINEFRVEAGQATYVDSPSASPLELRDLNLRINNVRNSEAKSNEFPSPIHVDVQFGKGGALTVDGAAELLAIPYPAVHTDLRVDGLDLSQLRAIAARNNVVFEGGMLTAAGHVQLSSAVMLAEVRELLLDRVRADYVYTGAEQHRTAEQAAKNGKAATEKISDALAPKSDTVVKIVDANIRNSAFGFVNKAAKPEYRVFLEDVDGRLKNLSNRLKDGTGTMTLNGKFMGSGDLHLVGTFRPETKSPDFNLNLKIENTRLPSMNNLLRAHGKLDVNKGRFSVFTELAVHDGQVQGYIKPLFEDMDVYDRAQDKGKPVLKQLYEGVVGGISRLLQSDKTDAVATKAEVSGKLDNPQAGTWQALVTLIRNAFVRAVLPGFDRGRGG